MNLVGYFILPKSKPLSPRAQHISIPLWREAVALRAKLSTAPAPPLAAAFHPSVPADPPPLPGPRPPPPAGTARSPGPAVRLRGKAPGRGAHLRVLSAASPPVAESLTRRRSGRALPGTPALPEGAHPPRQPRFPGLLRAMAAGAGRGGALH